MKKILQLLLMFCCQTVAGQLIDPTTDSIVVRSVSDNLSDYYKASRPEIIPPSPQSMLFDRITDHSLDEAYGLADISIPLYEIEIKGVKIPIVLNYHSGGVRYYQYDGDVGANWTLNVAGYKISRTVRGKDDFDPNIRDRYSPETFAESKKLDGLEPEKVGKYYQDCYLIKTAYTNNQSQNIGLNYSGDVGRPFRDGEYDHFTFSTPTGNGHFIMDGNSPYELELSARIIEMNNNGGKIFDESGNIFTFGGSYVELTERSLPLSGDIVTSHTGWLMTSAVNPFGERIDFQYAARQIRGTRTHDLNTLLRVSDAMTNMVIVAGKGYPTAGSNIPFSTYLESSGLHGNPRLHTTQFLEKITTDHETIEIVRTTNFCPQISDRPVNSPWLIDKIVITGTDFKKTIRFNYKTSPENAAITSNNSPWHVLLKSVEFLGSDNSIEKTYKFDYYESGGLLDNTSPDLWGFYGNYSATRLNLPDFFKTDKVLGSFYSNQEHTGERCVKTLYEALGSTASSYFSDRSVNENSLKYFSLQSITHPTGGTTRYEYEPHRYYSTVDRTEKIGGGLRVKKIISDPGDGTPPIETHYEYETGVVSADIDPTSFMGWDFNIGFYVAGGQPAGYGGDDEYATEILHNITRMYSQEPFDEAYSLFSVVYPTVTERSYDGQGSYNGKTVVNYSTSSPYMISAGGENEPSTFAQKAGEHFLITHPWGVKPTDIRKPVFVSSYAYYNRPTLLSKQIYNDAGKILYQEQYSYQNISGRSFDNLRPVKYFSLQYHYDTNGNSILPPLGLCYEAYGWISSFFDYNTYIVTSGKRVPEEKKTTRYYDEGNTTETEQYQYNSKYQLTTKDASYSDGNAINQTFIYPTSGSLFSKNMHSTVIEQITKKGTSEIGRIKNIYSGTQIVPSQVQTSTTGTAGLRTDITYDRYDSKGNVEQYTTIDGLSTVILWSYKQKYPVAEIKNATYSAVSSALGASFITTLSTADKPTAAQISTLDGLRTKLPEAQVYTYTYKHPSGMLTATDQRGVTTYYTYDTHGRLIRVSMKETAASEEVVLETYTYNYRNQ